MFKKDLDGYPNFRLKNKTLYNRVPFLNVVTRDVEKVSAWVMIGLKKTWNHHEIDL